MILVARARLDSCPGILAGLALFPAAVQIGRYVLSREHVRVPGDQLVRDPGGDVVEIETVRVLGCDLGMEDHLEQQVAELLAQMSTIAGLDRLDGLGGLLDQVLHQRPVSLLGVPGAGVPEGGHDLGQSDDLRQRHVGQSARGGCGLPIRRHDPAAGAGVDSEPVLPSTTVLSVGLSVP
jgi:hypothetical protein